MTAQPVRLSAQGLNLQRQARKLLTDLSVQAQAGEFVAVIGPNGAGKSTLLRVLAGLEAVDSGQVRLDGEPLSGLSLQQLAQRRAYLPQRPRSEWSLSVAKLVALGLTPTQLTLGRLVDQDHLRIEQQLRQADLLHCRNLSVHALSGGEFSRAMLAHALVNDPSTLLVDEPLTGLDPLHAQRAAMRLAAAAREEGRLVVAVLHDLSLVWRFASQVWALKGGQLLAAGPSATVLTPALLQNLFDVEVASGSTPNGRYFEYSARDR